MSERVAEVISINLEKHPNADSLSVQRIGGFSVVVNTNSWAEKKLAVYIPPETIVNTTKPEFSFLATPDGSEKVRVKVKKLRGIPSMGCLVDCPEGFKEGDNLWDYYELEHYEPELSYTIGGNFAKAPSNWSNLSKYDLENLRQQKYRNLFTDGEEVIVTEKLNGSNMGVVFSGGELYIRSRSGFRSKSDDNEFWSVVDNNPNIVEWCMANPDMLLYGEMYGHVKGFKYGRTSAGFRCFDVLKLDRNFLSYDEVLDLPKSNIIDYVPLVARIPFDFDTILSLAEQPSFTPGTIREGVVVRSVVERNNWKLGRAVCKLISNKYLEKS